MDEKPTIEVQRTLNITRNVYTQGEFEEEYAIPEKQPFSLQKKVKSACRCSKRKCWKITTTYLPIIKFIRHYNFRLCLLGDFLSGLTVSFMHLPQGMGFGLLAGLRPVHGLYSTFFPVLIYLFFGTSPYISFGTNAVMALLTKNVVEREEEFYKNSYVNEINGTSDAGPNDDDLLDYRVHVAMACSVLVGIYLAGMGLLRMGFLTTYLAVSFVGGFTTAAAVHITSSQVPKMLGIKVGSYAGAGKLVKMYIDLFTNIAQIRWAEVIISVLCIVVLLLVKICINERLKDKMKMPVPIDLIVVIIGTIISHFAKFNDLFSVTIVGPIPTGVPAPDAPAFGSFGRIAMDCFVMAILSFAMSISMAKLTAKKHGRPIDDNQEIVAYGMSNIGSGFFFSFPSATAPPRTMILSSLGATTTLNAITTSVFMLLVLIVIGQLFVSLPLSVLAAMIVVSMKDLLLQVTNLPNLWHINKPDFLIWLVTCAVSIFADLDIGIIAGVGISILLVVIQSQLVSGKLIGLSRKEDMLVDCRVVNDVYQPSGIKIFRFQAPMYFATAEPFKSELYNNIVHPIKYKKQQQKKSLTMATEITMDIPGENDSENESYPIQTNGRPDVIILDFRSVNFIDLAGVNMLQQIVKEYKEIDVEIAVAGCPSSVKKTLERAKFFDGFAKDKFFHDVFDAIERFKQSNVNGSVTKV